MDCNGLQSFAVVDDRWENTMTATDRRSFPFVSFVNSWLVPRLCVIPTSAVHLYGVPSGYQPLPATSEERDEKS